MIFFNIYPGDVMAFIDSKIILLVEDEFLIALSTKDDLENLGYNIVVANSGEEAIDIFNSHGKINLIIMDIDLGDGIDGTETAEIILNKQNIPIIFMSSHTEPEIVEKTEKITSYGYVVKNSSITAIDASIKMAFKLFEANQKIQKSENKFRAIIDKANIGLSIVNSKGIVEEWNECESNFTGIMRKDAIDRPVWELMHIVNPQRLKLTEYKSTIDSFLKNFSAEKGKIVREVNYMYNKEKQFIIENSLFQMNINGEKLIVSFNQDITERKRTEEALQNSEKKYRQLFDLLPFGGEILDTKGKIINCSLRTAKILGYEVDELIGESITKLLTPESKKIFRKLLPIIIQGNAISVEISMMHTDGSIKNFLRASQPIFDKNSKVESILVSNIDITDRKKNERALKQSEIDYRSLFDNATDAIYIQDLEGHFLDVNQGALKMYGYPKEFFIGKTPEFLSAPGKNDMSKIIKFINNASKGKTQTYEFWGLRRNGEIFPKNVRSQKGFYRGEKVVVTFATDITDQKKVEESLKKSEERFRSFFENSPISLWEEDYTAVLDYIKKLKDSGINDLSKYFDNNLEEVSKCAGLVRILDVNSATLKIYEAESKEELFNNLNDVFIEDSLAIFKEQIISFSEGDFHFQGEGITQTLTGRKNNIKLYTTMLPNEKLLISIFDITDRKKTENLIGKLLTEKDMLLKEVHHRIKNNMNIMRTLFSMQSKSLENPEAYSVFQDAIGRIDSMGVLYDKLYKSEKYQKIKVKEYINQLIREIFSMFPSRNNIKLKSEIEDFTIGTKVIFSLGLIINELMTNSMKYAFPNDRKGIIAIDISKKQNHVKLIFADNGVGMTETGKSKEKGFGHSLIELLTKQIKGNYKINKNKGLKFIIEFDV